MITTPGDRAPLERANEYHRPLEAVRHFNEIACAHSHDASRRAGGWLRIDRRENVTRG